MTNSVVDWAPSSGNGAVGSVAKTCAGGLWTPLDSRRIPCLRGRQRALAAPFGVLVCCPRHGAAGGHRLAAPPFVQKVSLVTSRPALLLTPLLLCLCGGFATDASDDKPPLTCRGSHAALLPKGVPDSGVTFPAVLLFPGGR